MARFVILEHDHPVLHWDLMLEAGEVLRTWRLSRPPEQGRAVPAKLSFDHRLEYLDYEGPVRGGRGAVQCWARGTFSGPLPDTLAVGETKAIVFAHESGAGQMRFERVSDSSWIISLLPDSQVSADAPISHGE